MDIIDAIRTRRSVRTFDGEPLPDSLCKLLSDAVESATSPFGGDVAVRLKKFDLKGGYRPSTYGIIKGASDFFLLGFGDDEASALTAGFRFEQVVLKAWQMGLGTCWISSTFKGSVFGREQIWPDGAMLKIVSPVGFPAKQSILERVTRLSLGSRNRKSCGELFFSGDFRHPYSGMGDFATALEMMRLAPSSANSQPWRALVVGDTVHFYYKPHNAVSVVDCGIGLCHFHESELANSFVGRFFRAAAPSSAPSPLKYLCSYIRSNGVEQPAGMLESV